jgi:hypothetical protein
MFARLTVLTLLVGFFGASIGHAQVTVDVAKVTCRQYLTGKIATPRSVVNWLSGYFHGKRGDTTLDHGALSANVGKFDAFCRKHYETPLLEAAEKLL